MNLKLIALVVTSLTIKTGFAQTLPQQVINTTGGTYQQGHFSVDWSVGELAVVNTMQSGDFMVNLTNGFMQTITDMSNIAIVNTELKKRRYPFITESYPRHAGSGFYNQPDGICYDAIV